jgi:hypothetical protein
LVPLQGCSDGEKKVDFSIDISDLLLFNTDPVFGFVPIFCMDEINGINSIIAKRDKRISPVL